MPKACPGLDPGAEGGSLPIGPIWSSPADPPLSLRDISPRKGGRGESEDMHQSLAGGEWKEGLSANLKQ